MHLISWHGNVFRIIGPWWQEEPVNAFVVVLNMLLNKQFELSVTFDIMILMWLTLLKGLSVLLTSLSITASEVSV